MADNNLKNTQIGEGAPEEVNAIIEIPKGSHNKYEYDEEQGVFKLDRVLHSPLYYPTDYGFIPHTKAEDGDPLDVMIIGEDAVFPGCVVECRVIGMLKMKDEGEKDSKILAAQTENRKLDKINDIEDLKSFNPHFLKEVVHFFETYKQLENKEVEVYDWENRESAIKEIEKARQQ